MNIYLLTWDFPENAYYIFTEVVVAANSEFEAQNIQPYETMTWDNSKHIYNSAVDKGWPLCQKDVKVKLIGVATQDIKHGVILKNFSH